jgi:hypothetical protein
VCDGEKRGANTDCAIKAPLEKVGNMKPILLETFIQKQYAVGYRISTVMVQLSRRHFRFSEPLFAHG